MQIESQNKNQQDYGGHDPEGHFGHNPQAEKKNTIINYFNTFE